jgi:ferrochelatase
LLDVRGGRPTSPEFVEEIRERYQKIGGRSPILELTQAQARALESELNRTNNGIRYHTWVGMRHWHPYIQETMAEIASTNPDRLVGLVMAPHYSRMSVGAYARKLNDALRETGAQFPVIQVESWHLHPLFIEALADHVTETLARWPEARRRNVYVLYTAHSLPERILADGDPYPVQLFATARAVAEQLGLPLWSFAFQSAGSTNDKWLGPAVEDVLPKLAAENRRDVLIAPIGFVCDHVEILYDVDIEFQDLAHKLGIRLRRIESMNDDPTFIRALADVVRTALER